MAEQAAAPAGRMPPEFMAELRRRTDLVAVIGSKVVLRQAGRELVGLCPFHEERTPSFYVSPERQVYHCHGCHAGGDAIEFVRQTGGLSFAEAVEELAVRAGLVVPAGRPVSEPERRRQAEREELLAAVEAAAAFYRECLTRPEGREAIAYLRARGVDGPSAARFDLGYAPADWEALGHALERRFAGERLVAAGLRVPREQGRPGAYDRFRHRVIFPIADDRGRTIALGGRTLEPGERVKYLNSAESRLFQKRQTLYALHLARPAIARRRRVVVVEGYMDALSCHQFGFEEAVASLGTALSEEQAGILARMAESVVLAYDADPAGNAATERGLGILQRQGARVEVAELPSGQDPDDLLRSPGGAQAFGVAVEAAVPLIRHLLRRAVGPAGVAGLSPERRWALAERMLPYLSRLNAGARLEYTEWVARELLVRPSQLQHAVDALAPEGGGHRNSKSWNPSRVKGPGATLRSGADAAEETVLAACLRSTESLLRWIPALSIHDFGQPAHKALVERLAGWAQASAAREPSAADGGAAGAGGTMPPESPAEVLLDTLEDSEPRGLVARLLAFDLTAVDDVVLRQCVLRMRRARQEEELLGWRAEDRRLATAGEGLDSAQRRAVVRRISELTAELAGFARGGSDG